MALIGLVGFVARIVRVVDGGVKGEASSYTNSGSLGGICGLANVAYPVETVKSGYIGQLYLVTGLTLAPTFVDNGTTQELSATQTLDDGTLLALAGGNETWSVIAGPLPAGLTLNMSTGVISGTPIGTGPYSFTVLVTDGLGDSAQQTFSGTGSSIATTDTPTLPVWGLAVLATLLLFTATKSLPGRQIARTCPAG